MCSSHSSTILSRATRYKARLLEVTWLLVGARPRGPGMERGDLLEANGEMNYEGEPGRTIWLPIVMGPTLLTTEGQYGIRIALGDAPPIHETFLVKKTPTPEAPAAPLRPN